MKTIKNRVNQMLKIAKSEEYFDFLPQCFICNISKQKNGRIITSIYTKAKESVIEETEKIQKIEDILSKVFKEKIIMQKQKNNLNNEEVLQEFVSENKLNEYC